MSNYSQRIHNHKLLRIKNMVKEELVIFYRNIELMRTDYLLASGIQDLADSTMDNYEFKNGKILVNYKRVEEIMEMVEVECKEMEEEYGKMVMSAMNQRML